MNKKYLKTIKQRVSRKKSFNLFPRKTSIQVLCVYIVRNIKPCQTQLILNCVLWPPMRVNHPKLLTGQKLSSPFSLFSLERFQEFVFLGGRIEPITFLALYLVIKLWKIFYKKPYQSWQTTAKTLKKHQNIQTRTLTKEQILFHIFSGEYTMFLSPLLFLKGENKISKKSGRRGDQFVKKSSGQKGRGKGK